MSRWDQLYRAVRRFHKNNPEVWDLFCKFTNDRIERGFKNYSADAIMHRVRWETSIRRDIGDRLKICNNHITFYARAFMRLNPEHEGFFRLRRQPSRSKREFSDDGECDELRPADADPKTELSELDEWPTTREKPKMRALDKDEVRKCKLCPNLGEQHVPASGSPGADLMIIGQSPGVQEVKEGQPFVGPSGELVEGMLADIPLGREDCYITNVLKCHPPGNRPGVPSEKEACFKEWLRHEIKDVSPRVILLLGKDAWSMFQTKKMKHGLVLRVNKRTSLIYWYHPAYYLRRANVSGFVRVAELVKQELDR